MPEFRITFTRTVRQRAVWYADFETPEAARVAASALTSTLDEDGDWYVDINIESPTVDTIEPTGD
jgi:hypothetical protein